jgi:hypothetical protein
LSWGVSRDGRAGELSENPAVGVVGKSALRQLAETVIGLDIHSGGVAENVEAVSGRDARNKTAVEFVGFGDASGDEREDDLVAE